MKNKELVYRKSFLGFTLASLFLCGVSSIQACTSIGPTNAIAPAGAWIHVNSLSVPALLTVRYAGMSTTYRFSGISADTIYYSALNMKLALTVVELNKATDNYGSGNQPFVAPVIHSCT